MNVYLLGFLFAALIIGLWAPRRAKSLGLIAAMTAVLVLSFYFFPRLL